MLLIEHFRKKELIAVALLAVSWTAINLLLQENFYISITFAFASMALLMLMTCRLGRATLSVITGAVLTMLLTQLGIIKYEELLLAGIIAAAMTFELGVMIISKTRIESISLTLLIPAIAASAAIPWAMLLFSGTTILEKFSIEMINMTLASQLSSVAGTAIALLIWRMIKTKKFVLRIMHE